MKSILMSIRPKWVAKILNGIKTKEIRKLFPKNFRGWVYIYCTKNGGNLLQMDIIEDNVYAKLEKDCDIEDLENSCDILNGKVVARFYCDNVTQYINGGQWHEDNTFGHYDDYIKDKVCELACVSEDSLFAYANDLAFNAIHISKLEIFDYPKELNKFHLVKDKLGVKLMGLTKAPQSYCYVVAYD